MINFAQGEMAMFTTYIAWTLIENHGWSYWPAFVVDARLCLRARPRRAAGGDRSRSNTSVLTVVIMTIGLVLTFNGAREPDLVGGDPVVPESLPERDLADRRRLDLAAGRRHVRRRRSVLVGAAVGVLPVHEGRPRPAGLGAQPGREPARRRARRVDARHRLGPRRDARRRRGDARRSDGLPRPEHDAGDPDLRLCGGRARRDRLAAGRRRRGPDPRRRPEPDRDLQSTSSAPT